MATDYSQNANVKGCYSFSEGSGTTLTDSSSNGNNGSFTNIASGDWDATDVPFNVSGSAPNSVILNSASDAISFSNTICPYSATSNKATIAIRVNPSSISGDTNIVIKGDEWKIILLSTGVVRVVACRSSNQHFYGVDSSNTIGTGSWSTIIATFDSSSSASVFVNGTTTSGFTFLIGYGSSPGTTAPVTIGYSSGAFLGKVTDVGFFSDILNSTQITEIYGYGLMGGSGGGGSPTGYMTTNKGIW